MQLRTSIGKLRKEEVRAIKFELLDLLREGLQAKRKVIVSAKKLDDEHKYAGQYDPNERIIVINPDSRLDRSVEFFIHENLHMLFRALPERSIDALAKKIFKDLTIQEKGEVFKIMAAESEWDD